MENNIIEKKYVELINISEEQMDILKDVLNKNEIQFKEYDTQTEVYFSEIAELSIQDWEEKNSMSVENKKLRLELLEYLSSGCIWDDAAVTVEVQDDMLEEWIQDFFNEKTEEKVNKCIDNWEKRIGLTISEKSTRRHLRELLCSQFHSVEEIIEQNKENDHIFNAKVEAEITQFFNKMSVEL